MLNNWSYMAVLLLHGTCGFIIYKMPARATSTRASANSIRHRYFCFCGTRILISIRNATRRTSSALASWARWNKRLYLWTSRHEWTHQRARAWQRTSAARGAASCWNLYIKKWIRLKCHTAVLKFKNSACLLFDSVVWCRNGIMSNCMRIEKPAGETAVINECIKATLKHWLL